MININDSGFSTTELWYQNMTQKYTFTQILEEIDKIDIYPEDRITKNWKHYKNMHTIIGKPTNYTLKKLICFCFI